MVISSSKHQYPGKSVDELLTVEDTTTKRKRQRRLVSCGTSPTVVPGHDLRSISALMQYGELMTQLYRSLYCPQVPSPKKDILSKRTNHLFSSEGLEESKHLRRCSSESQSKGKSLGQRREVRVLR